MNTLSFRTLFVILSLRRPVDALSDFSTCHDDFGLKPPDGMLKRNTFGWLAFVQYMHVTTGLLHLTKSPRVVLIQKQFVVGTAVDLLKLPKNYKLGNVIFGEYDREEKDCDMTRSQLKEGRKCPYAYFETALLYITPHPEYSRFGVGNSLALGKLLRPIKSRYMMPICLPSITERRKKRKNKFVFMVDYMSTVPKDLDVERMGKKTLKLYTHKQCRSHRMKTVAIHCVNYKFMPYANVANFVVVWIISMLGSEGVTHVLCSTGCGVRPGAPIVSHNMQGAFELIGVATGGALCDDGSMRRRFTTEPPLYIDVYPYTRWIINVISANELPLPFPKTFRMVDGRSNIGIHNDFLRKRKSQKSEWRGRTFVSGNFCFKNSKKRKKAAFFYSELFLVKSEVSSEITIDMKISAGIECTIVCARLLLPNRLANPQIQGVGGYNISVHISTKLYPDEFLYTLGLLGKNTTKKDFEEWLPEYTPW